MTGIPPPVAASAELLPGAGQRLVPPIHARDAGIPAEEEGAILWAILWVSVDLRHTVRAHTEKNESRNQHMHICITMTGCSTPQT